MADGGYVLLHVLEVQVPGRELGDCPGCQAALGNAVVECPVPSTLQSENVTLATQGEVDPVIRIRAFDSRHGQVGMVIVPVSSLNPLEVWNVWYQMDDDENQVAEDRPPEETPKMHLLLQFVPADAAGQETAQVREMRGQDFLLRALQQLNASLEAKVMEHHKQGPFEAADVAPELAMNGATSLQAGATPSRTGPASDAGSGVATPAPVPQEVTPGGYPGSTPPAIGDASSQALALRPAPSGAQPAAPDSNANILSIGGGKNAAQRAQIEEMLRVRVGPYEKIIAALEEKQRFYDDQETRMRVLTKRIEELEALNHNLQAKLKDSSNQMQSAVSVERECARRAESEKAGSQQQIVELQQEVALRTAHEDSLQRRVTLMETELSVVHQKCMLVDSAEEEAQKLRQELAGQKELRRLMQEQVEDMARQVAKLQEEACQVHEDHSRDLENRSAALLREQQSGERLRQSLQAFQDTSRDKEAECRLQAEKVEELSRQICTLEAEVGSFRTMHEREKVHRKELETRLSEQELNNLSNALEDHRQTIRNLGEEVSKAKNEAMDQTGRLNTVNTELAMVRRELAQERRVGAESRAALAGVEELRSEAKSLQERNEELRAQVKSVQEEMKKVTDHYEHIIHERAKAEQQLCRERDDKQKEVGQLRTDLHRSQTNLRELQSEQERLTRSIDITHTAAERSEELQRQLQAAQEEVRNHHVTRERVHKDLDELSTKFRDDTVSQDRRSAEMEAALEDRNNEIKLLMYRVQELSSKYVPVRNDAIDVCLSKWVNGYRPAVPFFRLAQGLYMFGRRQVICKISNDKPVFRVGGGFVGFDKFLELYASEELEKLLSYEVDDRTGEPKFSEASRVKQAIEESGLLEELRERAELQVRGKDGVEARAPSAGGSVPGNAGARRQSPTQFGGDRRRGA